MLDWLADEFALRSFLKALSEVPSIHLVMKSIITPSLIAIGLAMSHAAAQDGELPDHNLSEFELGEHLFGEEVTMKSLKGRVVVLEKWGVR